MLDFATPPSMAKAYARAVLSRKRQRYSGGPLPRLQARLAARPLDAGHLARYRDVCGQQAEVPLGYPQLLVTPLHIAMLTRPEFPVPAMGLVHPRCAVVQHRALHVGEPLELVATLEGQREVKSGIEFDLATEGRIDGELVWESRAATFYRTRAPAGGKATTAPETWDEEQPFDVPANAGRRYARVSGDANPVHLAPWSARLFGYRRPIAHGWWLLARCVAALGVDDIDAAQLELELKRPVWLGTTLRLSRRDEQDAVVFAVVDEAGKERLRGRLRA